jgi:hypothetical protein
MLFKNGDFLFNASVILKLFLKLNKRCLQRMTHAPEDAMIIGRSFDGNIRLKQDICQ